MISNRTVLVCHSKTCLKDGASEVLAAFEQEVSDKISIQSRPCTGECGSGPIVIVLPDQIWYSRVHPKDVPLIVRQHLREGKPVTAKLYSKYHHTQQSVLIWGMISGFCVLIFGLLFWFIASQTYYF